jgi:hypothetical protein
MIFELNSSTESAKWANEQFGDMWSTDKRRKRRVMEYAARMKDSPGKSIPQLFETEYGAKSVYNVLKHNESTPELIQKGHLEMTKEKLSKPGIKLLIEDDSEFSWSNKASIDGLGPIGGFALTNQGFVLHTTIAAEWNDGDEFAESNRPAINILGIADQQHYNRQPGKKKQDRMQGRPANNDWKETDPWFHSMERIGQKPDSEDVQWIRVCDRRADIFEQLEDSTERGYDYIIRAAQDRAVLECEQETGPTRISKLSETMTPLGHINISLRGRPCMKAREAQIELSAVQIKLRPPSRKGVKKREQTPVSCTFVYAKEVGDLQEGIKPIEWKLFTSLTVDDFSEARTIVRMYTARWVIEEFHKTLKSGLRAEDLQLEHGDRIKAAISIMSIVAVSLLEFREMVRLNPNGHMSESKLSDFELKILERRVKKPLTTIRDVALAIGRLGGHLNRSADGLPGLMTLWRGWRELHTLVEGARLVYEDDEV